VFGPIQQIHFDDVAQRDVFEPAEESVTVSGDADVAAIARPRRVFDVADSAVERPVVGPSRTGTSRRRRGIRSGEGRRRVLQRLFKA
jgi:hypothetical protein